MVKKQIVDRGVKDKKVIGAMLKVPRHKFVDNAMIHQAYYDNPLPIGFDQTISQPYIVALMTEALLLSGNEKVLEIGTGSGYQAAILAEICEKVFSIERNPNLAQRSRKILDKLGYNNIAIRVGDGTLGWKEYAPFDRIIITAAAPKFPETLFGQLKNGGVLVIPEGDRHSQVLKRYIKTEDEYQIEEMGLCAFVPLIGKEGW